MKHIEEFKNRIIQGDNIEVMRDMPDNSVDLVYSDPPFNTGNVFKYYHNNRVPITIDMGLKSVITTYGYGRCQTLSVDKKHFKDFDILRNNSALLLDTDIWSSDRLEQLFCSLEGAIWHGTTTTEGTPDGYIKKDNIPIEIKRDNAGTQEFSQIQKYVNGLDSSIGYLIAYSFTKNCKEIADKYKRDNPGREIILKKYTDYLDTAEEHADSFKDINAQKSFEDF